MSHSIFYISPSLDKGHYGGSIVAKANLNAMLSNTKLETTYFAVHRNPMEGAIKVPTTAGQLGTALANLFMLCATLSPKGFFLLLRAIRRKKPDIVWLDSSLLGILIPLIKIVSRKTKIACFFHNIESDLVRAYARENFLYWFAYIATITNEHLSAKYADQVITIQKLDGERLKRKYSLANFSCLNATVVDIYDEPATKIRDFENSPISRYALFVGSDFPPNIEALRFLNDLVAPKLTHTKIVAVGNGLEKYRSEFPRIKVNGRVDKIAPYYKNATAVLAPLFSGGGMKVKIAEALMFNRGVVASTFGAIGYENVEHPVIQIIDDPDEFARCVEEYAIDLGQKPRECYLKYFSPDCSTAKVEKIINDLLI